MGLFRAPARAPFCADKKGRKSRLEPAVLRTPFCPDVYWRSCSLCVAVASERRWTLRLPPSPRFKRAGLIFSAVPAGGYFAAPAASPFLCGQKGAKKPLRTCGSKDSLCPDVYWGSCSLCVAVASERRWTLRLPPNPRFKRAGLAGRRRPVGQSDCAPPIPSAPAYPMPSSPCGAQRPHIAPAPASPQWKPPGPARSSGHRPRISQVRTAP